ncbi:hypothetical protein BS50DRAFT_675268 [Corynespora cassiicola Philippines]|uniref:Uncharacterized protein n=1 Tax=Corynespora cassiicola Philippines TaxID=1448308 RepID=A0A2T2NUF8_CORCC|nr:hypothetical protein BS50DRAFT_675268 [Corynespora cassiicola Philippines]
MRSLAIIVSLISLAVASPTLKLEERQVKYCLAICYPFEPTCPDTWWAEKQEPCWTCCNEREEIPRSQPA